MSAGPGEPHLEFVYTTAFEASRKGVLTDEEVRWVELSLLENPEAGVLESGTGGVRKIRAAQAGRGKRGSARVMYFYVRVQRRIYFLLAFAKNEQASLTDAEKNTVRKLAERLRKEG